jgi:hypothetical protein
MKDLQLELGLVKESECRSAKRPYRRRSRSHEWFERMRQIVDKAAEWEYLPKSKVE